MADFQGQKTQADFSKYSKSKDGQIERDLIWDELRKRLPSNGGATILDAACGDGWLTKKLITLSPNVFACDISESLIAQAKREYNDVKFDVADITKNLPYENDFFDFLVWNLGAHDVFGLEAAFQNLYKILKPSGKILFTIANPYYSYPVGKWKRDLKNILFGGKPKLLLDPYCGFENAKKFEWGEGFTAYFRRLPEYVNTAIQTGFILKEFVEIVCKKDSQTFDRQYQLYRFPMILLLEFEKPAK